MLCGEFALVMGLISDEVVERPPCVRDVAGSFPDRECHEHGGKVFPSLVLEVMGLSLCLTRWCPDNESVVLVTYLGNVVTK